MNALAVLFMVGLYAGLGLLLAAIVWKGKSRPTLVKSGIVAFTVGLIGIFSIAPLSVYLDGRTEEFQEIASKPQVRLSCDQIERARRKYQVEVIDLDNQEFGVDYPKNYKVRVRVTNNSQVELPILTVLYHQFDSRGEEIGSGRNPSVPLNSVAPGETVELEQYVVGHMFQTDRVVAEVEDVIPPDVRQYFDEVQACT